MVSPDMESGVVNRQAVLYQRQLLAIEQIWGAVISLAPAKTVSSMMSVVKFEAAADEASKNPKFREVFKVIDNGFNFNELGFDAPRARPFVTPLAWAYYSAYHAILGHNVGKMKMLQVGLTIDLTNIESISKLVKVALPHHTEYIDKHGTGVLHILLDELELSLLTELKSMLRGQEADKEHIEKAALILQESERLIAESIELQ